MKNLILFFTVIIMWMSCENNERQKNGFYDYSLKDYYYRLPTIAPYELLSPDNGVNWTIALKQNSLKKQSVQFLSEVGIQDSIIVAYSPRELSFSSDHPEVWVIIDLISKEEFLFVSKNEYLKFFNERKINVVKMYKIIDIYSDFNRKSILPAEWPVQPSKISQ